VRVFHDADEQRRSKQQTGNLYRLLPEATPAGPVSMFAMLAAFTITAVIEGESIR
jgi:hypothetical protein